MALAAICPHCQTMFRVASDQLKLRGGIVRCGACHEVFDGNAALVDLDAIPVQETHREAIDAAPPDDGAAATPVDAMQDDGPPAQADADAAISALPVLDHVVQDPRGADADADAEADAGGDATPDGGGETGMAAGAEDGDSAAATPDAVTYTLDFDTTLAATPDGDGDGDGDGRQDAAIDAEEHLLALPPPADDSAFDRDPFSDQTDKQGSDQANDPAGDQFSDPFGGLAAADAPQRPPAPVPVDSLAPLLMRASAAAEDRPGPASVLPAGQQAQNQAQARARRAKAAAERRLAPPAPAEAAIPPAEAAEDDEPEFVRRSRQREASGERTRLLLLGGCIVLALALLVQGVWTFRNTLAARYPGARPLLGGLCAVMGCKVELPMQIDALAVETGELQTLDATTFSLTTLLRNQGDLVQAWPHLELALTDANDKTLVRKVFAPADYLPPGALAARGFAARSEQSVKLNFQLDQIKASGYHLAIFYP